MAKPRFRWDTPYPYLWIGWIVSFLVIEFVAIADSDPDDTLSEHVWTLMNASSFIGFAVVSLLVWLIYHFVWERRGR